MKRPRTLEVLIVAVVVLIGVIIAAVSFYSLYANYNNSRNINPALIQAFSSILLNCSYTNDYHERVACDLIKEAHGANGGRPTTKNAEKWRIFMMGQGYSMPPLYKPGYSPW